jgi:RimJ/RimL family protein N-acetyltransferase
MGLRPARWSDARDTLAWRNDVGTRFSRPDSRYVAVEEHLDWLGRRMKERSLYIAELCGKPVGQVTLDADGYMGWIVAAEMREAGIGRAMLLVALRDFASRRAKMSVHNAASIALARSAGFKELRRDHEMVYMLWECEEEQRDK